MGSKKAAYSNELLRQGEMLEQLIKRLWMSTEYTGKLNARNWYLLKYFMVTYPLSVHVYRDVFFMPMDASEQIHSRRDVELYALTNIRRLKHSSNVKVTLSA